MFDTLFWALYWIDVLSSLDDALILGAFAAALAAAAYVVMHDASKPGPDPVTIRRSILRVFIPVVLACQLINMVPSKETMYMMLAVRTTDKAVSSETGQRLMRALNKHLDKYIEKLEK